MSAHFNALGTKLFLRRFWRLFLFKFKFQRAGLVCPGSLIGLKRNILTDIFFIHYFHKKTLVFVLSRHVVNFTL